LAEDHAAQLLSKALDFSGVGRVSEPFGEFKEFRPLHFLTSARLSQLSVSKVIVVAHPNVSHAC
jgi:hypothetical protein